VVPYSQSVDSSTPSEQTKMKNRVRFSDSFLKAFDAHDTKPDAAVRDGWERQTQQ
jgi:hypothetical protein